MQICLLALLTLFSITSFAKLTVKQSIPSKAIAILEVGSDDSILKGDEILFNRNGKQCSTTVVEISTRLLTVNTSACSFKDDIAIGEVGEKLLMSPAPSHSTMPEPSKEKSENAPIPDLHQKRYGVALHTSYANTLTFDKVTVKGANSISATGSVDMVTSGAIGLDIAFSETSKNHWGYGGLVGYEADRAIAYHNSKFPAQSSVNSGIISYTTRPNLSLMYFEGQAIYLWNELYTFVGLNYSIPGISAGKGATDSLTLKGNFGVSLGLGYYESNNSSVEIFIRSLGISATGTSNGASIDFGDGTFTGFGFGIKYSF